MNFEIAGPFKLPRGGDRHLTRDAKEKATFWRDVVEQHTEGLSSACGCYMFADRNFVWYVGRASKQSFQKECFRSHKIIQIDDAMRLGQNPTYLYLVPLLTSSGGFRAPRKGGYSIIENMERHLIDKALRKNGRLLNKASTKFLKTVRLPGVLQAKKADDNREEVQRLKKILGLDKP